MAVNDRDRVRATSVQIQKEANKWKAILSIPLEAVHTYKGKTLVNIPVENGSIDIHGGKVVGTDGKGNVLIGVDDDAAIWAGGNHGERGLTAEELGKLLGGDGKETPTFKLGDFVPMLPGVNIPESKPDVIGPEFKPPIEPQFGEIKPLTEPQFDEPKPLKEPEFEKPKAPIEPHVNDFEPGLVYNKTERGGIIKGLKGKFANLTNKIEVAPEPIDKTELLKRDFTDYMHYAVLNNMDNRNSRGMLENRQDIDRRRADFDAKHPGVRHEMIESIDKYATLSHLADRASLKDVVDEDFITKLSQERDRVAMNFESRYGISIYPFSSEVVKMKYQDMDPIYGDLVDYHDYRRMRKNYTTHRNLDRSEAIMADLSDPNIKSFWKENRAKMSFEKACCKFMEDDYSANYNKSVWSIARESGPVDSIDDNLENDATMIMEDNLER